MQSLRSLAVAVVSYNAKPYLKNCLETVVSQHPSEVIVVDNASTDGSVDCVRSRFQNVSIHVNPQNVGYGAAANEAVRRTRADAVLLLNCDTRLARGALTALRAYLDAHPRAAVVGPRLVSPAGVVEQSRYPFFTPLQVLLATTLLNPLIKRVKLLRDRYLPTAPHDRPGAVPWVKGAAIAIRREAFEAVGGFDSSYFLYLEETDLCHRLWKMGWEVHFTPSATIEHVGGASTLQKPVESTVEFFRSLTRFYQLHYSWAKRGQLRVVIAAIMLARIARDEAASRYSNNGERREAAALRLVAWRGILRDLRQGTDTA